MLGRKVKLKIVDDTCSPDPGRDELPDADLARQGRPRVRSVLDALDRSRGAVASRYHYAFVEPAGGGPAVFAEHLDNVFFVQPAPDAQQRRCVRRSTSSRCRPRSVRRRLPYPSLDDPFSSPIADRMRSQFETAGIKTVFKTIYPPETADLTPIVAKVVASKPDMVVGGTQSRRRLRAGQGDDPAEVQPQVPVPLQRRELAGGVPDKVGAGNIDGHLLAAGIGSPDRSPPATPTSSPPTSRSTAATASRSTPARPRPTRSGS